MTSSHHLTNFQLFSAASVMLCCSAPLASSNTPLRPSVSYPSIRLVASIIYIRKNKSPYKCPSYFRLGWHRFEVRLGLYDGTNSHIIVSLLSLSPSHPPMSPPSQWPAPTALPNLAKFQLVWHRWCEALLSSSSPAGQKHPSLLSCLL